MRVPLRQRFGTGRIRQDRRGRTDYDGGSRTKEEGSDGRDDIPYATDQSHGEHRIDEDEVHTVHQAEPRHDTGNYESPNDVGAARLRGSGDRDSHQPGILPEQIDVRSHGRTIPLPHPRRREGGAPAPPQHQYTRRGGAHSHHAPFGGGPSGCPLRLRQDQGILPRGSVGTARDHPSRVLLGPGHPSAVVDSIPPLPVEVHGHEEFVDLDAGRDEVLGGEGTIHGEEEGRAPHTVFRPMRVGVAGVSVEAEISRRDDGTKEMENNRAAATIPAMQTRGEGHSESRAEEKRREKADGQAGRNRARGAHGQQAVGIEAAGV
mmetsp:Transcript_18705/g.53975  ORF Transcript_18705/g.53975 Transcript_18705/m.53975 type:complete len:319 (+) Transcript_18705:514-1470(+)